MADYAVTGRKGAGKSLYCIGVIRDAIAQGKRVATNLNIRPESLVNPLNKSVVIRLPDKPIAEDLIALGRGQEGVIEDDNGIIVLDETSMFFNSRSFADKTRQPLLDYLVQSRKYGWDVYYICQGLAQIDKQLRETMIEYHIQVVRTDKWSLPLITPLFALFGLTVKFPKYHIGVMKYGTSENALVCGRKWYKAKELYDAYDTQQLFLDRHHPQATGLYSILPAYHVKGRYMSFWDRTKAAIAGAAMAGAIIGLVAGAGISYAYHTQFANTDGDKPVFTLDEKRSITGRIIENGTTKVYLSDGTIHYLENAKRENGIDYFMVGGKWLKAN